jgi:hypothetical protein
MSRPRTLTKGLSTISPLPRLSSSTEIRDSDHPVKQLPALVRGANITARMITLLYDKVQELITRVSGLISFGNAVDGSWSGDVNGQYREVTFPVAANTQYRIEHGLNRIPVFFIVQAEGIGLVYADDSDRASWNKTEIYLKCNVGSVKVKLLIV